MTSTPDKLLSITELPTQDLCGLLANLLLKRGALLATGESCTGGLIAAACTDVAGSSQWFDRGFVTYSNEAKTDMLGVDAALILQHGAVSEPVVQAMARGALKRSRAMVSVAVTGIAGPTGGSADKPVGTVWFGWAMPNGIHTEVRRFEGDRQAVRNATVRHALATLVLRLQAEAA